MKNILLLALTLALTCYEAQSDPSVPTKKPTARPATASALENLRTHLSQNRATRQDLTKQKFARLPLTRQQAEKAANLVLSDRLQALRAERKKEFDAKSITIDGKTLRYEYRTLGNKPKNGHSLYISMHGGGGAPARVNDQQWKNQINLYTPDEGIYLAPRAPTDTWNLWHQAHIDPLFDRLIENFIAFKGINPNKIYLLGYSAGGDGAYQLAPRMADRWAAASMMAGHPGDAQTWNLRNLPFFIQCGGQDTAYDRNKRAAEWGTRLDKLAAANPGSYPHKTIVYPQHGHWMQLDCKQALPWMAKYTRNPWPKKIHWHQDDVTGTRFYWLENRAPKPNQLITAEVKGQTIVLTDAKFTAKKSLDSSGVGDFTPLPTITLRLSDKLINLDQPIIVKNSTGKVLFRGKVSRTIASIATSLHQRPDLASSSTASLTIALTPN